MECYSVIRKVIVYYWQMRPPITITITITITGSIWPDYYYYYYYYSGILRSLLLLLLLSCNKRFITITITITVSNSLTILIHIYIYVYIYGSGVSRFHSDSAQHRHGTVFAWYYMYAPVGTCSVRSVVFLMIGQATTPLSHETNL